LRLALPQNVAQAAGTKVDAEGKKRS
ncbi:MAG: hypothetical protein HZLCBSQH_002099, partial [Candidatus Fervidibacterota bacterium]